MADNVLRLKVESQEYDAKIKRAAEGLQHFVKNVRESGGSLKESGILARSFLMELGNMETVANGGKQQLREMSNALVTLTQTYRQMSQEEKNSGFGQELAKQIQILTERAGAAKDAMVDVEMSIKNASSDTRSFDQIAQGMNVAMAGFQGLTGAGKLLGIEMGNDVEVIAKLQAAMAVTNSLTTIQTALQKQSALMQGVLAAQTTIAAAAQTALAAATGNATIAQKAFNVVANANPYVLLATAVIAVGSALYAFSDASAEAKKKEEELAKAAEDAKKKADEQRLSFVNASAEAMNSASRLSALQVAYKNANREMEKTGILKQAQAEFKKLGIECKGVHDAQTLLISRGGEVIELIRTQGTVAALSAIRMEKFKESFKMLMENGYSASAAASLAGYNKEVAELDGQITNMQSRIQGLNGSLGVGDGQGKGKKEDSNYAADSIKAQEKEVQRLTDAWQRAGGAVRDSYKQQLDEAKAKLDSMMGKTIEGGQLAEVVIMPKLAPIGDTAMGEEMVSDLTTSLVNAADNMDLTSFTKKFQEALANGASDMDLSEFFGYLKDSVDEYLSEDDWLKLRVAVETGDMEAIQKYMDYLKKAATSTNDSWKKAASSVNQLGNALQSIEDPGAKAAGQVLMAVSSAALGFAEASKGPFTNPWEWIAFAASGMATMITLITSIHSATGMKDGGIVGRASGGFVPGQNYSGDNILANGGSLHLDSGELVLNRAQQGILANALDGGGIQNLQLETVIEAEDIKFVLNSNGRRTMKGEFVQSRNYG